VTHAFWKLGEATWILLKPCLTIRWALVQFAFILTSPVNSTAYIHFTTYLFTPNPQTLFVWPPALGERDQLHSLIVISP
jgi:hypothetical protein